MVSTILRGVRHVWRAGAISGRGSVPLVAEAGAGGVGSHQEVVHGKDADGSLHDRQVEPADVGVLDQGLRERDILAPDGPGDAAQGHGADLARGRGRL
eukprot:2087775-Pyramimonas_sp.AAC.1